jgi:hypothetical protein
MSKLHREAAAEFYRTLAIANLFAAVTNFESLRNQ